MNTATYAVKKRRRLDGAQRAVHQRNPLSIKQLNKSTALPLKDIPGSNQPENFAETNIRFRVKNKNVWKSQT
jgi:hypothetical protein